jgi:3-isopropylmalate dehydrogenase
MGSRTIRLAVIGGDGIGPEVTAEALKVLRTAAPEVAFDETTYERAQRGARARPAPQAPVRA